jgi:hypothetical protein
MHRLRHVVLLVSTLHNNRTTLPSVLHMLMDSCPKLDSLEIRDNCNVHAVIKPLIEYSLSNKKARRNEDREQKKRVNLGTLIFSKADWPSIGEPVVTDTPTSGSREELGNLMQGLNGDWKLYGVHTIRFRWCGIRSYHPLLDAQVLYERFPDLRRVCIEEYSCLSIGNFKRVMELVEKHQRDPMKYRIVVSMDELCYRQEDQVLYAKYARKMGWMYHRVGGGDGSSEHMCRYLRIVGGKIECG